MFFTEEDLNLTAYRARTVPYCLICSGADTTERQQEILDLSFQINSKTDHLENFYKLGYHFLFFIQSIFCQLENVFESKIKEFVLH